MIGVACYSPYASRRVPLIPGLLLPTLWSANAAFAERVPAPAQRNVAFLRAAALRAAFEVECCRTQRHVAVPLPSRWRCWNFVVCSCDEVTDESQNHATLGSKASQLTKQKHSRRRHRVDGFPTGSRCDPMARFLSACCY